MELNASNTVCDLVGGCARDRRLQVWNSVLFTYFWFLELQNYCCYENWGQMERNGRKLRIFGVRFQNQKFGAQFSQNTKFWVFVRMFVWKFGKLRWVQIFSIIFRLYEWKFGFLFRLREELSKCQTATMSNHHPPSAQPSTTIIYRQNHYQYRYFKQQKLVLNTI